MSDFTTLPDLAARRLGGMVLIANDEFFAPKENLLEPGAPVFDPDRYTDRGKEMDGWETRRRRDPGHDWCIVRLGVTGIVRGVVVDTSFFRGNYPDRCSVEGAVVEEDDVTGVEWFELLPESPLEGDSVNRFDVASPPRVTHLRLNIFPDGGVARLRVHGEPLPDLRTLTDDGGRTDVAASLSGGSVLDASDLFFSSPHNLIAPGDSHGMHDGWETRRRRGEGHDWVVLRLAAETRDRTRRRRHVELQGELPGHLLAGRPCHARRRRRPGGRAGMVRGPLASQARPTSACRVPDRPAGACDPGPAEHPSRRRGGSAPRAREGDRRGLAFVRRALAERQDARVVRGAGARVLRLARVGQGAAGGSAVRHLRRAARDLRRRVGGLSADDRREAFAAHPRIGEGGGSAWARSEQAGTADTSDESSERSRRPTASTRSGSRWSS